MKKFDLTRVKAALIDMDGVLYDSMPYHARAWHEMLGEQGIKTDPDEFFLYEGMTGGATIDLIFLRELGRQATDDEKKSLYARKSELFTGYGRKELMPGASNMLNAFRAAGIDTILVTGSAQGSLLQSLDNDYPGFFPKGKRVTALDVKNGKPHPEPYLKGIEKAGVATDDVIVIENAPLGVRAGKAAGCYTIAVTTGPIPREEFEKEGADMIFSSMWEFATWLSLTVGKDMAEKVDNAISGLNPSGVVVVTDENVNNMVIPFFGTSKWISKAPKVIAAPGENNKNFDSLCKIWETLSSSDVTRNGLVVNIGGGMVTDIGGFAAATFKRGIRYVNIPTTLLGATDAATGGKTAVNFMGLKNEIGAFHVPSETLFFPQTLSSLPRRDLLAGYAEMVKTAMIADNSLYKKLLDVESVLNDSSRLEQTVGDCVKIKEEIVALDPYEKGLRKVLNLGHTAGHAFESFLLNRGREIRHGEAVAHGLLVALILSHLKQKLPSEEIWRYANEFLKTEFSRLPIDCSAIEELTALMAHDKKNERKGELKFVLLREIGSPLTDCTVSEEELQEALELYCDIMG